MSTDVPGWWDTPGRRGRGVHTFLNTQEMEHVSMCDCLLASSPGCFSHIKVGKGIWGGGGGGGGGGGEEKQPNIITVRMNYPLPYF